MRSGKTPKKSKNPFPCDALHEDDQVDPRIFFRKDAPQKPDRKTLQLCRQARDLLSSLWSEQSQDFFLDWSVEAVEPAPNASRLRVMVHSYAPHTQEELTLLREHLAQLRPIWREFLAHALQRKHAPDFQFELLHFQSPQEEISSQPQKHARPPTIEHSATLPPTLHTWLIEPLSEDIERALRKLQQSEDVHAIAIMPDVHLAEDICIGTVVATKQWIYPNAVGGDIGCGMASTRLDVEASALSDPKIATALLAMLYESVPANKHPHTQTLPSLLQETLLSHPSLEKQKAREGCVQFGTLGAGNHFLEFQADEQNRLWLTLHSGSRAMGQAIRHHHLRHAKASRTKLQYLDSEAPEGQAYLHDLQWALDYATANRQAMMDCICSKLQERWGWKNIRESLIQCHHNHVQREQHQGQWFWVHRKGANHAHQGNLGIIPGSMGTPSYLVEGRGHPEALCSSSHGAGRLMSRSMARQQVTQRDFYRQMQGIWFDHRQSKSLIDEAPAAYKDIHAVMRAQHDLVRILHTLRPLLSYKGR